MSPASERHTAPPLHRPPPTTALHKLQDSQGRCPHRTHPHTPTHHTAHLGVDKGVEVGVVEDHGVGGLQVDAQAARPRADEEDLDLHSAQCVVTERMWKRWGEGSGAAGLGAWEEESVR